MLETQRRTVFFHGTSRSICHGTWRCIFHGTVPGTKRCNFHGGVRGGGDDINSFPSDGVWSVALSWWCCRGRRGGCDDLCTSVCA